MNILWRKAAVKLTSVMMMLLCITCSYKFGLMSVDYKAGTCKVPDDADDMMQEVPENGKYA